MMTNFETQAVQALSGVALTSVTLGIAYASTVARKWLNAHLSAQQATTADQVVKSLQSVADGVVNDFNQRVVNDAKVAGKWSPELEAQVRADAYKAVRSQGAKLIALGSAVLGDMQSTISSSIESAVVKAKTKA